MLYLQQLRRLRTQIFDTYRYLFQPSPAPSDVGSDHPTASLQGAVARLGFFACVHSGGYHFAPMRRSDFISERRFSRGNTYSKPCPSYGQDERPSHIRQPLAKKKQVSAETSTLGNYPLNSYKKELRIIQLHRVVYFWAIKEVGRHEPKRVSAK